MARSELDFYCVGTAEQAIYFIPILLRRHFWHIEESNSKTNAGLRDLPWILVTFHVILIGWIFFRTSSVTQVGLVFPDFHGS